MVASGLTAASPPKFVSLEEIMQAANGMRDMALVHQIVVDEDFKLKRAEPPPNSIQKMIKETMHKAFWDVLREQLAEEPPNYTQVSHILFSVLLLQERYCTFSFLVMIFTDKREFQDLPGTKKCNDQNRQGQGYL